MIGGFEFGDIDGIQRLGILQGFLGGNVRGRQNLFHRRVGFRVDSSLVKRVLSAANPQESGGLLIEPLADSRNILQLFAARELAILGAKLDDALGHAGCDPRNTGKQVNRSCVEIGSDPVHAGLNGQPELGP